MRRQELPEKERSTVKDFFRSLIRRAVESFPIDGEKKERLLKTLLRISRKQGADG